MSTDATCNATFPIDFPNAVFGITATIKRNTPATSNWGCYAQIIDTSTFTIVFDMASSSAIQKSAFIIAIGY